jgi:hypothetical protein
MNHEDDLINASDAIAEVVGSDNPMTVQFLTFSEGTSNKYHFFALFEKDGEWTAANAYAGFGKAPKVCIVAEGDEETVRAAYLKKIGEKIKKGYKVESERERI